MHPGSRVRVLGLVTTAVVAVAGCSREQAAAPQRAPAAGKPLPAATDAEAGPAVVPPSGGAAESTAALGIDRFDCWKGEEPAGLSTWGGGGPSGSAWNVDDLRCEAVVRAPCTKGTVDVELRIGKGLVARRTLPLAGGPTTVAVPVGRADWRKNLDDGKAAPYRTAVFRVTATMRCQAPAEIAPGLGPRGEYAVDRLFVAGFADGE